MLIPQPSQKVSELTVEQLRYIIKELIENAVEKLRKDIQNI